MQPGGQQNEEENHPYFAGCVSGGVRSLLAWSIVIFEMRI